MCCQPVVKTVSDLQSLLRIFYDHKHFYSSCPQSVKKFVSLTKNLILNIRYLWTKYNVKYLSATCLRSKKDVSIGIVQFFSRTSTA